MYNDNSYQKHKDFIENSDQEKYLSEVYDENNPIYHYNLSFFNQLLPLLTKKSKWLTVGDYNGIDAIFLKKNGAHVTASDLTATILETKVLSKGLIDACSAQNVENLSFANNEFDFVCCKEAYHHFPRPPIGFYEMLRVAKNGVIILEPSDINIGFPPLMFLRNIIDRFNVNTLRKFWKNQYSYEVVGNFVYKVSFREFEKMAVALDLPAIAVKGFNSAMTNRWENKNKQNRKIRFLDFLCKLSVLPYQHLAIIVFKSKPDSELKNNLTSNGYRVYDLPKNPYN